MLNNLSREQLIVLAVVAAIALLTLIGLILLFSYIRKKKKEKVVKKVIKKDSSNIQEESTPIINVPPYIYEQTVQEFLPFNDISDSMICLTNGEYVTAVEVGSVNYYLRTAEEQTVIENQFRDAISSWDFPFTLYVQTRKIDNSEILRILQEDHELYANRYPELREYSLNYIQAIRDSDKQGSGVTKRYYVIVSCKDANYMNFSSEEQRRDYAYEKISLMINKVWQGLANMGITVTVLNNVQLVELLNSSINKNNVRLENDIASYIEKYVSDGGRSLELSNSISTEDARKSFENTLLRIINNQNDATQRREAQYYLDLIRNKVNSNAKEDVNDTFFEI